MTENCCPFEPRVAEAVKTGSWSDELRSHLAGCAACEETHAVAGFMSLTAEHLGRHESPPDPALIWLRSELARRDERETRERRTWLWSGALTGVAATLTAWASLEWIAPVITLYAETFAVAGASIALTLGILYFTVYRPLGK